MIATKAYMPAYDDYGGESHGDESFGYDNMLRRVGGDARES